MLCLVGDGPDRGQLEQVAHELGIARSCFFVGYQEDVAGYYRLFDAFLLPSVTEGTPVSAIESLASGTPVVANRVGGVPDVVRDGVDGFLVEAGRRRRARRSGSPSSPETRAADARLGEAGRAGCSSATPSRGSSTTSTACTARCCARRSGRDRA